MVGAVLLLVGESVIERAYKESKNELLYICSFLLKMFIDSNRFLSTYFEFEIRFKYIISYLPQALQ